MDRSLLGRLEKLETRLGDNRKLDDMTLDELMALLAADLGYWPSLDDLERLKAAASDQGNGKGGLSALPPTEAPPHRL